MRIEIPPHSSPHQNKDCLLHDLRKGQARHAAQIVPDLHKGQARHATQIMPDHLHKGQARHATQIMPDHLHKGQARHATQIRPVYDGDRLGQGDPLMKASMEYWRDVAHHQQNEPEDKEVNLIGKCGSPLCFGINDIVHIDKDTIMSFPCGLPAEDDEDEKQHTSTSENHLQQHGSPLCGLGFSDIVHIDKNTVLSIPCLPLVEDDDQEPETTQVMHQDDLQDILARIR